jgi:hypothetical protein
MSSFQLKLIAITSMFIDHIGAVFFEDVIILRIIGRLAFPIFAFLISEGITHTKDIKRYTLRLIGFALITEVIFDLAFYQKWLYLEHQNVLFTFAIAVIIIIIIGKIDETNIYLKAFVIFLGVVMGQLLYVDHGGFGVLMVIVFVLYKDRRKEQYGFVSIIILTVAILSDWIYAFSAVALAPISFYNGSRGMKAKYIFYAFYPLHLLGIYIVTRAIG